MARTRLHHGPLRRRKRVRLIGSTESGPRAVGPNFQFNNGVIAKCSPLIHIKIRFDPQTITTCDSLSGINNERDDDSSTPFEIL